MEGKIVIAYVCDSRYLRLLKASIASVRRYNKDVEIAVLTDKPFALEGVKVFTIHPDTSLFKFRDKDRMRDGVYFKFFLPSLPYKKVLYLDCDVLCQRPLKALWSEKCEFICLTESYSYGDVQAKGLGLKRYGITGMMLMNLDALRKERFTERCFDRLSRENPKFHDETIINVEFSEKLRFIDKKYNYCRNRAYKDPIDESDAYLLHFVGAKQKRDMLTLDNFRKLDPLKRLLSHRRVAIVGNASGFLKNAQGQEIDAHDVVIRFNKGFPSKEVGFKTDIVFLACTLTVEECSKYGSVFFVRRSKKCLNDCDFNLATTDRVSLQQAPTRFVTEEKHLPHSQASTGFIAVNFALSTDCESIDLYGFDGFKSNSYYNPVGYQTYHNGDKEFEKLKEFEDCGLLTIR